MKITFDTAYDIYAEGSANENYERQHKTLPTPFMML